MQKTLLSATILRHRNTLIKRRQQQHCLMKDYIFEGKISHCCFVDVFKNIKQTTEQKNWKIARNEKIMQKYMRIMQIIKVLHFELAQHKGSRFVLNGIS